MSARRLKVQEPLLKEEMGCLSLQEAFLKEPEALPKIQEPRLKERMEHLKLQEALLKEETALLKAQEPRLKVSVRRLKVQEALLKERMGGLKLQAPLLEGSPTFLMASTIFTSPARAARRSSLPPGYEGRVSARTRPPCGGSS